MTRKPAPPAAALPDFEDGRFYAVDLARLTPWKRQVLSPAHNPITMRGDVARAVQENIGSATLLPEPDASQD